jgi:hypothetical protein
VIDCGADVSRHATQLGGRAVGVIQYDIDGRAHDRERGPQFVEALAMNRFCPSKAALEPVEHLVEGLGQLVELVAGTAQRDAGRAVLFGGGARGRGDPMHRA